jgi:hypothetical protein
MMAGERSKVTDGHITQVITQNRKLEWMLK